MIDFKKIRVLVTDGDGKQPLAMIRGLKELGCHVTVLCGSKKDTCYVSNKPDEKILIRHRITRHTRRDRQSKDEFPSGS